jgi:hypothetical protein
MITKEIERLNNIVENKNREIQNLTGAVSEGENAQRNLKSTKSYLKEGNSVIRILLIWVWAPELQEQNGRKVTKIG